RVEHLDRPQIVGHPAHLDGLAHAPIQLWGDEVKTAEADAVLGDSPLGSVQQQEAEVGGWNLADWRWISPPTLEWRLPCQRRVRAFGVVVLDPVPELGGEALESEWWRRRLIQPTSRVAGSIRI